MLTFSLFIALFAVLSVIPVIFKMTGEEDFEERWEYRWLARPFTMGSRWALAMLIALAAMDDSPGREVLNKAEVGTLIGMLLFCVMFHPIAMWMWRAWGWSGRDGSNDEHRRGQAMRKPIEVAGMVKQSKAECRFNLGGVPIPRGLEDRSFLFAGSPGSGKSQAIQTVLDAIYKSTDRAIITDPSAQFLQRYKRDDSIIINPLDERSVPWSPFAEFRDETYQEDARTVAQSLVPTAEAASAEEWRGFVRSFLRDVLIRLWELDRATNANLNYFAAVASADELRALLAGTPSHANLLGDEGGKLLGSVRTTGDQFIDPIGLLDPAAGKDGFSIREWVLNGKGWVFITYQQNRRSMLTPIVGAMLNVFSDTMLTRKISKDRAAGERIWGVFDEFPLLGKISSFESLVTNGSKHGFAGIVGIQTIAQLRQTYGRETAQTILACLGTWLVLRCSDAETAQYMAQQAGKEEVMRTNQSGGSSDSGSSKNWSQQVVTQDVLLASEIQNWPDLFGVLNLAGSLPICNIFLQIVGAVESRCPDFILRQRGPRQTEKPELPQAAQLETGEQTSDRAEKPAPAWSLD